MAAPLPAAGWASTPCRPEGGPGGQGLCKDKALLLSLPPSLPAAHSPFFLKKARSDERFLPMKTTMVAGERVWSRREAGLRRSPRRLSLLCRGGSHPACAGGADAGGPQLPPSVLIRTGGRMLGQAKTLRRSCL